MEKARVKFYIYIIEKVEILMCWLEMIKMIVSVVAAQWK